MGKPHYKARMPNAAILPYKLLTILLFGKMKWVKRDSAGWTRSATIAAREYLKTNPENLRAALTTLENWGVIKRYNWYKNWFEVELEIPMGMAVHVPAATLVPSEGNPEVFEMMGNPETETSILRQTDPRHPLNYQPKGETVLSWREDDGQE